MPRSPEDPPFVERRRRPVAEAEPVTRRPDGAVDLAPGEWAVLGLVAEGPTHGFALAADLDGDGALGRIWSVPRPVVYQSLKKLGREGLTVGVATQRSRAGPARTIVAVTPHGRDVLEEWLRTPVHHVRDLRSLLLVKLALLDRAGRDPAALLGAQRDELAAGLAALDRRREQVAGMDHVVATWRWASHRAAADFIDAISRDRQHDRSTGPHLRYSHPDY